MNKQDLIAKVADRVAITKKDAEKLVTTVFEILSEEIATGEKVSITDFGIFEAKARGEREGRHPQTGDVIKIAETKTVKFKPSKILKDTL